MRLASVPLAALLLTAVLPAAAATAADRPVQVTAVLADGGHLSFRTSTAVNGLAGGWLARHWRTEARVVAAAVDRPVHLSGEPDPRQSEQWALTTLAGPTLWDAGGAAGQVVAVIDTGVDASHPDLAGVVRPGRDFVTGTGTAQTDGNGHGTHVAGIVAALAGNGIGGAGLAQGAVILPVRVLGNDGSGYDGDAARGLVWAADHGATVANLSFGGVHRSSVMDAAVSYALNKGVSVVVSAGNDGANGDPVEWPAAAPGVIAVAAVDADGVRPAWSSTGAHVAVSAPGVHILSTVPGGGYESWSGTSMAAPFVSAAAALLRHAGVLTPSAVRSRLMATADDLGAPGFDPQYGAGRINVVAAEGLASSPAAPPVAAPDPVAAEPAPVDAPVGAPVEAPAADPAAVGSEPAPDLSQPADAPAVVVADGARVAASRPRTGYRAPVYVSTRALSGGQPAADVPVRLERSTPGGWAVIRTGVTDSDGLLSWQLRPDRTASYRAVGAGFASAPVSVAVAPIRISRQVRSRAR